MYPEHISSFLSPLSPPWSRPPSVLSVLSGVCKIRPSFLQGAGPIFPISTPVSYPPRQHPGPWDPAKLFPPQDLCTLCVILAASGALASALRKDPFLSLSLREGLSTTLSRETMSVVLSVRPFLSFKALVATCNCFVFSLSSVSHWRHA